ncbi:MAG: CheW domain-containing protein [Eubacterium sp.]|nr:CheW domain-containing protein [Eubacterium sp.]
MKEVVCFILKDREFGVDVSQMRNIANRAEIEPRDDLPGFVKGIVTVHGERIPLVDQEQLLQIPDSDVTKKNAERKIAIFQSLCGDYAMECDGISEIVSVEDTAVQAVPGYFNKDKTNYADCVVQKKNRALVVVINPDGLLSREQCSDLKKLIDTIEEERREEERKRIEEERLRKEEEKRKREEEIARMQEESEDE